MSKIQIDLVVQCKRATEDAIEQCPGVELVKFFHEKNPDLHRCRVVFDDALAAYHFGRREMMQQEFYERLDKAGKMVKI